MLPSFGGSMIVNNLEIFVLPVAVAAAVIATKIAKKKGRRSGPWGFYTFLFPPLLLVLYLMPPLVLNGLPIDAVSNPEKNRIATPRITIEKHQRGFWGKIIAIAFWGWHLFMGFCFYLYFTGLIMSDAALAVALLIWLCGAIILGLMMYFTKGPKVIITHG